MYILGGTDASTRYNDVQYAPLSSNGNVGTWASTTSFTNARGSFSSVAYRGYIYILAGSDSGTQYADVQYASINTNGTVGTWNTTTSLPSSRNGHKAIAYRGYMYSTGGVVGATNQATVHYSPINTDGSLGSWTATTSFATARLNHGVAVNNGYMYIMGGTNGPYLSDVQYAAINSDGTIGTWNTTTNIIFARGYITPLVINGYMYTFGGFDGTSNYSRVDAAPINANGTLGTWSSTTSFTSSRYGQRTAVYEGYLYVVGGYTGSYLATTQYAPVSSIARKGNYSKVLDLGAAAYNVRYFSFNGSLQNNLGDIAYKTAGSTGSFGGIQSAASIAGTGSVCGANATRYVWERITLDDSYNAGFPDTDGAVAYLTDISVNYGSAHPDTNTRLHGGKFFQSEILQGLDSCGT